MKTKTQISNSLLIFFSTLVISLLVYLFYSTDLRERLETIGFDIRSKIKPQINNNSNVALVTIDDQDLEITLSNNSKAIPQKYLIEILKSLKRSKAKAIALILPHQDYIYQNESLRPLANYIKEQNNIYFGLFDIHEDAPSDDMLPKVFEEIKNKVGGVNTFRRYRQGVMRRYPLYSYLGEDLEPQLVSLLALKYILPKLNEELHYKLNKIKKNHETKILLSDNKNKLPNLMINYWQPESFTQLKMRNLLKVHKVSNVKDKIVLIGYLSFRARNLSQRDGTLVNTPWNGETNHEQEGTPLLFVLGSILDNLLQLKWLQEAPLSANIIQIVLFSTLSFIILRLSPALAVMSYLISIFMLFWFHGLLFSVFSISLPIADTILFSFLSALTSTFFKSRDTSRRRIISKNQAKVQSELARMQGHFLNQFAFELFDMNKNIQKLIKPYKEKVTQSTLSKTIIKALISSEELGHYLSGIAQYSRLHQHAIKVNKKTVNTIKLLERVLNQFEAQISEQMITINSLINKEAFTLCSDEILLEPILFNLISNAIKYSPSNSTVKITIKKHKKKQCVISVSDNGCGIPKEQQKIIFQKFYRVKNDHVHRIQGNGLGLYLCQYFAEKIGAVIELNSKVNKGSDFLLFLDRA